MAGSILRYRCPVPSCTWTYDVPQQPPPPLGTAPPAGWRPVGWWQVEAAVSEHLATHHSLQRAVLAFRTRVRLAAWAGRRLLRVLRSGGKV